MTGFLKLCLLVFIPTVVWGQAEYDSATDAPSVQGNSTLQCWACAARYKTWADCQNNAEKEYCEQDLQDGEEVTCMKSTVHILRADGELRYRRIAGCALNETALQEAYLEAFEVTYNETSDSSSVTLAEFGTCQGMLCNVMDEEALRKGPFKVTRLNVIDVNGGAGLAGSVVVLAAALLGVLLVN